MSKSCCVLTEMHFIEVPLTVGFEVLIAIPNKRVFIFTFCSLMRAVQLNQSESVFSINCLPGMRSSKVMQRGELAFDVC